MQSSPRSMGSRTAPGISPGQVPQGQVQARDCGLGFPPAPTLSTDKPGPFQPRASGGTSSPTSQIIH